MMARASWESCWRMLQTSGGRGAEAIILDTALLSFQSGDTDSEIGGAAVRGTERRLTRNGSWMCRSIWAVSLYYSYVYTPAFLANGIARTLADSRYILVEFSPGVVTSPLQQGLSRLLENGSYVILAHLERYDTLYQDFGRVEELYNMGVYLQANARPVYGKTGGIRRPLL